MLTASITKSCSISTPLLNVWLIVQRAGYPYLSRWTCREWCAGPSKTKQRTAFEIGQAFLAVTRKTSLTSRHFGKAMERAITSPCSWHIVPPQPHPIGHWWWPGFLSGWLEPLHALKAQLVIPHAALLLMAHRGIISRYLSLNLQYR